MDKLGTIISRLEVMMRGPKKDPYAPPRAAIPMPTEPQMRGIAIAAAKYFTEWVAEMDEEDRAEIEENDSWDDYRGDSITVVTGGWPHPHGQEILNVWLGMKDEGLLP